MRDGRKVLVGYLSSTGLSGFKNTSLRELVELAATVFKIPAADSVVLMLRAIRGVPPGRRKALCREYRNSDWRPANPHLYKNRVPAHRRKWNAATEQDGPSEKAIAAFYASWEWKRLSYDVKLERGRRCECCGASAPRVRIHTDHVKPLRSHWNLRLEKTNLQILCEDCNMGKGSRDETDFRPESSAPAGVPLN